MLVYEKKVSGHRKLFGTLSNLPSGSDTQLIYKDLDGDSLVLVAGDSYYDDGKGGIIRKSDGKPVNVFIGTKNIIPGNFVPEPKVITKIEVSTKPTKTTYVVNETLDLTGLVITATYKDGDKAPISEGEYTTSPEEGAALTVVGDQVVTVTCGTKTTTFKVTVTAAA